MPAEEYDANTVTLAIGGREHRDWTSYEIDSDLLTPADGWRVSLGIPAHEVPDTVRPWAPVTVAVGPDVVLTGRIDRVERSIRKGQHTLSLSGRDGAAVLVDCSAPIFVSRQVDVADAVAHIVRPLGITRIRVATGTRHEKITVEPGMTAWDALQYVAEANGMFPWFLPDGTLFVGGPDYTTPPVGELLLRFEEHGQGNNVLALAVRQSIEDRFSDITVLGQHHGTEGDEGKPGQKATAKDASAGWYRPKIVVESQCDSADMAKRRARKILADGRLAGLEISATVRGHRVTGNGVAGPLWEPGQRVRVFSEPHGLDDTYFVMRRTFIGGRDRGQVTELTLKEDGVWLPDVSKRHKKGRKGKQAMELVDL